MQPNIWHHLSAMGGKGSFGGVSVAWGVGTDVGLKRAVNEDASIAQPPVFVVADGMGGHEAGDVASALAIERFCELSEAQELTSDRVAELIRSVNEEIFLAGRAAPDGRSMGTTAVGLVLVPNGPMPFWLVFNIGDSRVYRSFGGVLELLSQDHSYVQELVAAGHLDASAARTHPQRNVVTRALGVERAVQADLWMRAPEPGERFLLCSDGLSSEIGDDEIGRHLGRPEDPDAVASSLVAAALDAGGRDNVTVLVLDVIEVDGAVDQITAPRDRAVLHAPAEPGVQVPEASERVESDGEAALVAVPGADVVRPRAPATEAAEMIAGVPAEWVGGSTDDSAAATEGELDD